MTPLIHTEFGMDKEPQKKSRKITPPKPRRHLPDWLAGIIAALLVHLVLFLLFRPAPVTSGVQLENKAFITQLSLNTADNRELAQWVTLHDPALMVSSDRRSGFSSVMNSINKPRQLDDLPQLLSLSVPRSPVLNDFQCNLPGGSVLPGDTVFLQDFQNLNSKLVTVTLNDRKLKNLDGLRKMLSGDLPQTGKVQPTIIYAASPAQPGWLSSIKIRQSSGSGELDRRAVSGARRLLAMPEMANISGELAFIWPSAPVKGGKK